MKNVLICGVTGGVLITILKWTEYQLVILDHSVELYSALIAGLFAALGIWLGCKLTVRRQPLALQETLAAPVPTAPIARRRDDLGITRRELEILELIAQGMSNKEIAGKLYVSENTIKTHCSHAFDKLGAKRRTQAVQLGKELGLLR